MEKAANKKSNNKVYIIVLAVLFGLSLLISGWSYMEGQKIQEELNNEKQVLISNIEDLEKEYQLKVSESEGYEQELQEALSELMAFKEKLQNMESKYYSDIRKYKNQLNFYKNKLAMLEQEIAKLKDENVLLNEELTTALDTISVKTKENLVLSNENDALNLKIKKAGVLHVDWVKVDALSRSKKGYSETSRYKSTDAFRITIKVAANEFAEQGKRDVFVTLKNPNGIVMNNQGVFDFNGEDFVFSGKGVFEYRNSIQEVTVIIPAEKDLMKKGNYTVEAYLEGKKSDQTAIELKSKFLGLF